ncbi:MAG: hypothetical protein JSU00_11690 [Acidobacteria bacterium]|nr:hypothetical protein [Acidobacteriota bacterium]
MRTEASGARAEAGAVGPALTSLRRHSIAVLRLDHERSNAEAARLIVADAERFGGREGGLVRWAWLVFKSEQHQEKTVSLR